MFEDKSNLIIGVVVLLIVIGVVWQFSASKPAGTPAAVVVSTSTTDVANSGSTSTTSQDLLTGSVSPVVPAAPQRVPSLATIRVYLARQNATACGLVVAAGRQVPATPAIGRAAVLSLLQGPTAPETARGLVSWLNSGTNLRGLTINRGVATVRLAMPPSSAVETACAPATRLAQITKTLEQFPSVHSVRVIWQ